MRDWSISEVARLTGTTTRTLRHYGAEGLLEPSRIGTSGHRYYDAQALVTLQRILLLRDLGLGLPAITRILRRETDASAALERHLGALEQEQERLARRIAAVRTTIATMRRGDELMADEMFDGFNHTQYQDEVEQRWGSDAYASGDRWYRSMSAAEREEWQRAQASLASDWAEAARAGIDPAGPEAQALAERHRAWLGGIPGTPRDASGAPSDEYLLGLGELYVADERFAANYGGGVGAAFVRDALRALVGHSGG